MSHKFRLPTPYYSENFEISFFNVDPGSLKISSYDIILRPKGGNNKVNQVGISESLELYVVVSLNLCFNKSDSMQRESAQSDHPALSDP